MNNLKIVNKDLPNIIYDVYEVIYDKEEDRIYFLVYDDRNDRFELVSSIWYRPYNSHLH